MAIDLQKLADDRYMGEYLVDMRTGRLENYKDWKLRLEQLDNLYAGNFNIVFPNEEYEVDAPSVMNLIQVGIDDMARLVTESMPSVTVLPRGDEKADRDKAYTQEAAVETYWDINDGNVIVPRLAMDLVGAGACFVVADTYHSEYPCIHRIDPRYAYPTVHNGRIIDLLTIQSLKQRVAASMFPRFEQEIMSEMTESVEVIEFYRADECVQLLHAKRRNGGFDTYINKRWNPGIDMIPVGFAQMDSFDGEFRGMFDQIAGSLNTKNRIVKLMLDYTDRMTYAPKVSKGLLNPEEVEGPNAHFRLDPNAQDAKMERLGPPGPAPQLFNLLDILEREQRGGTSYPSQRQGEVNQSIASASFVNSTMGQLTTSVRNVQRLLGNMRGDLAKVCVELDKKHLDNSKPLIRAVGSKATYKPSALFPKDQVLRTKVTYGAGAGLDRLNADVRVLQHLGAGLISKETAREQIDYLERDAEESDRIEKETAQMALSQKFLVEAPWNIVAQVIAKMDKGATLATAIKEVMDENPETGATGATPGAAAPGAPGQAPMEEQLALQKGAGAGSQSLQKPQEVDFPSTPLTNILVGQK